VKAASSGSRRGKPSAAWTGASFEVRKGSRMLVVAAVTQGEESHVLVELDAVTHWNHEANGEPQESDELSIEDLHAILEAIEAEADEQGLSIDFE
jgi:hypothetical protein